MIQFLHYRFSTKVTNDSVLPVRRLARPFIEIIRLFSFPGSEFTLDGVSAALEWLDRQAIEKPP
jgi:hypothetical protein